MALYVPLDADYYHDPRMIDAGPMAELLYVRALCFAKRTEKDGYIAASQLRAIAAGLPRPRDLAAKLTLVGAWVEAENGWQISAWLKRNKSVAQIAHAKDAARIKSLLGNHERWHVKEGKHDPTCEMCNPYSDPRSDPRGDPKQSREKRSEAEQSEGRAEQSEEKPSFQSLTTSDVSTRPPCVEDDRIGPCEDEDGTLASISALVRRTR